MVKIYEAIEHAEIEALSGEPEVIPPRPKVTSSSAVAGEKLVSLVQPKSLAAEQFRKLRTHLLRWKISDEPVKTILVTSATHDEGKTFVAANLAVGIAHDLHAHALLVDCDLRNPSVANQFGFQDGGGLSGYLTSGESLSKLFLKTKLEKLTLLPGGKIQDNPTELIASKKMEALVQELKSRYSDRYIIFDSTPLLTASESEVLSKFIDGIVIVVRAGTTTREMVRQSLSFIDKAKIVGFVLNDLKFRSHGLNCRYFGSNGYDNPYCRGNGRRTSLKGWIPRSRE